MPSSPPRKHVWFTFGNHMHWVDMQWLWGYDVLPGSVRDMLRLCREAGVKGNINFDGIGYEKMAAECPDALAELREAIREGVIEPVGCSYGQPYGLCHGGESNIRQRVFGVRSVMRLLGSRPRAFWEEEFDFFPQLPQMLRGCGFTGACLFFQWTWHTPEVPMENASLILWQGIDGSRLACLPRNELNLHQWPEDFAPLLSSKLLRDLEQPAIVQWLELMPSRDWMCRSELLLPKLRELLSHDEFEIQPGTLSEVIAALSTGTMDAPRALEGLGTGVGGAHMKRASHPHPHPPPQGRGEWAPVRRYTMDDVWHGVSLGKNGDAHPRASRRCEHFILAAESLSALAGFFGRPYPQWDVYPTWEIDEAWRELLTAQHHDNHECEGLCGDIGRHSFARSRDIATDVVSRAARRIAKSGSGEASQGVVFNPGGWMSGVTTVVDRDLVIVHDVPPFGVANVTRSATSIVTPPTITEDEHSIRLSRGTLSVTIDKVRGVITQISSREFPNGVFSPERPLLRFRASLGGKPWQPTRVKVQTQSRHRLDHYKYVWIEQRAHDGNSISAVVFIDDVLDAIGIDIEDRFCNTRPDAGMNAGLQAEVDFAFDHRLLADTPLAIDDVRASSRVRRKYPTADWMTSPQWFEFIERPFTAANLVDALVRDDDDDRGVLYCHDGAQQFFRSDQGFRHLLTMYDPWDEHRYQGLERACAWIVPHGRITHAERMRIAARLQHQHRSYWSASRLLFELQITASATGGTFGALEVADAPNVLATAFHRESMKAGENLPQWAGHEIFRASDGACTHPYVIRLVEYDGERADVTLKLPGAIAMAAKTNLMGEVERWLTPEPTSPPAWAKDATIAGRVVTWSALRFAMRPREIATIMADLVLGRKQYRDLDSKREVWATVHRT